MTDLRTLLEISARDHSHLCPRQILGVRMGLLGMHSLGFAEPPAKKRLLVITEMDGCFADGLSAATGCTIGYRTLRIEDYGKTAAVFVDVAAGKTVRVAPALDLRQQAYIFAPGEPRHYFAQMQAYQIMPDEIMFTVQTVALNVSIASIISRPGVRVICDACGDEISNEREIKARKLTLCRACAQGAYYHTPSSVDQALFYQTMLVQPAVPGGD